METSKTFCLELSDGQKWEMKATPGASLWMSMLATIMKLRRGQVDGGKRITFMRRNEFPSPFMAVNPEKLLPLMNWSTSDVSIPNFFYHPDFPETICEIGFEEDENIEFTKMQHSLFPIYQQVQEKGGIPFHAALIEKNGLGIALAGPGGRGKSTCSFRLPPPWRPLCDDEMVIVKVNEGEYRAHPFPSWSDYIFNRARPTWDVRQNVPLVAVFFLQRSENDEVLPIASDGAGIWINQSAGQLCYRFWTHLGYREQRVLKIGLLQNAFALAKAVPSFILRVTRQGRFWEEMAKVLP